VGNQPWFVPGTNAFLFHSDRDGTDAVYRQSAQPAATAERFGAADTGTSYTTPFPSPDEQHIAFTRCVDGVNQLHVMRADGSRLQQLTFGDGPSMFPSWSPAGNRIVHVRGEPTAKQPTGRLTVLTLARH